MSAEEIAAACLTGQFIRLRFEGFAATPYVSKDGLSLKATAKKAVVVTPLTTARKEG